MARHFDRGERDRAVRLVRTGTVAGAGAAIGLAGLFSTAAAMTFSGKSAPAPAAPAGAAHAAVPREPAPQQSAAPVPSVVQHVIHRATPQQTVVVQAAGATVAGSAGGGGVVARSPLRQPVYSAPVASGGSSAPAPAPVAGRAPAPAPPPPVAAPPPPPPPPPACVSTPSKPC